MKKALKASLLLALTMGSCLGEAAHAAEVPAVFSLDEVVVSATRSRQTIQNAPASVSTEPAVPIPFLSPTSFRRWT